MKIGAENKNKLYIMIVLLVVAGYMVYSNLLSGPSSTPAPRSTDTALTVPGAEKAAGPDISRSAGQGTARPTARGKNGDFRPVLRAKKKEDRIDVAKVDPTIRFDLLDKVLAVPPAGGERDLFQILKAPPVKASALPATPEPKVYAFVGPRPPPPPPPPQRPADPPPPEPIPLKYYGYTMERPDGKRTAYFHDGSDDLPVEAIEGTILKGRYRIVSIGLDKVLVEDTVQKRRQSLNIEPEGSV